MGNTDKHTWIHNFQRSILAERASRLDLLGTQELLQKQQETSEAAEDLTSLRLEKLDKLDIAQGEENGVKHGEMMLIYVNIWYKFI